MSMFKKDSMYPDMKSETIILYENKTKGIRYTVDLYYSPKSLYIHKWVKEDDLYVAKKWFIIPLSPYSFYIQYIYKHLGKCPKELRSKFYIGKAKEEYK